MYPSLQLWPVYVLMFRRFLITSALPHKPLSCFQGSLAPLSCHFTHSEHDGSIMAIVAQLAHRKSSASGADPPHGGCEALFDVDVASRVSFWPEIQPGWRSISDLCYIKAGVPSSSVLHPFHPVTLLPFLSLTGRSLSLASLSLAMFTLWFHFNTVV